MRHNLALAFFVFLLSACALPVSASETVGTIVGQNTYAWGENMGWINFAPTDAHASYLGLTVTDTAVAGYAWSKEFGWINFSPTNSGQGVVNTSSGALSGRAWSSALGWINFAGVSINTSGVFTGVAGTEGSDAGRISFDCAHCTVATDWRPASARTRSQQGNGGGGIPIEIKNALNENSLPGLTVVQSNEKPATTTMPPVDDPIRDYYTVTRLPEPDRTPAPDYVESYNAPLAVTPLQRGLLVYDFGHGKSSTVQIPKSASDSGVTLSISLLDANEVGNAVRMIFGGTAYSIIAKDAQGNFVHSFTHPLMITLVVPQPLVGAHDIGVYWFDTTSKEWVRIPDAVISGRTATFTVNHLTDFAIFGTETNTTSIPSASIHTEIPKGHSWIGWIFLAVFLIYILIVRRRTEKK